MSASLDDSVGEDRREHAENDDAGDRESRRFEEVVEADGAELLEEHGQPEHGERIEEEGGERRRVVDDAVLANRRDDADEDAEHDRQQRCEQHEPERGGDGVTEEGGDVLALAVLAEVAAQDAAQPVDVPLEEALVEIQPLAASGDQLIDVGVRRLAQVGQRVTGDGDQEEHEERRREQDRDGDQHAASDEEEHEEGSERRRCAGPEPGAPASQ